MLLGEDAGPEEALLGRPAADHRLEAESGVRAHPEVLANAPARLPVRVLEDPRNRHLLRIDRSAHPKTIVPDERRHSGPSALRVMGGEDTRRKLLG